jgi:CubicO group peptidase (beta-lactamase class C family)
MDLMKRLPRATDPGMRYNYNTGETQVAAEILRAAVRRPLATYLSERIWSTFGMEADATWWLDSPGGTEIGGSGFSATLRDYGRFGLFVLGGGIAAGDSILPAGWLREATTPKVLRDGSPLEYGYLWWTGETPGSRRDGAFMAIGIHGQYMYLNPAANIVIVAWGARPHPTQGQVVDDWSFCEAVTAALTSH